ncbi:MAG: 2-C-methyl-D-erythritol 4-phosphate cytidylyltransferase [Traorella sp.]
MYSAIILAAGSGTRLNLGYNKLLYQIDEETIIEKTVNVFKNDSDCDEIILVISPNDEIKMKELFKNSVKYTYGGSTRQESSYQGVCQATNEKVMIHDGARPYVSKQELEACKEALQKYDASLLMVPVKDTIKIIQNDQVKQTLNRNQLMAALTPQCFKTSLIKECLEKAMQSEESFSDDASVVEKMSNCEVHVIQGSYANIKITTKEDI